MAILHFEPRTFLRWMKKVTNAVILQCINTRHSPTCFGALTLSQLMLHICSVSKTFGGWYEKTNKTENTNKLTLLAFKIIAILCCEGWRLFWRPIKLIYLYLLFCFFLVPSTEHFRHTTYTELPVKPEILTSCIYICISYPVTQLCVNTLLATKVTLITDGI
jgi:hypothetical protein